uniref:FAD-dependent oxidoreductase domain-containing protein 2 n=1 Tax=Petromyzon marinus TaxID=7757 RepID=A0AAJ7X957_PETMA|nr:FAD-dependent oxidoreductase domain-containing protein 2 [Petromyzon marinus]XP_032825876.1 FAD-dependent oxidoreductase domain-containing protein 2 [Petromyzon marinus]
MPMKLAPFQPTLCCLLALLVHANGAASSSIAKDFCVVGAGPSGLQMGYYLEQSRRDYVILERSGAPGHFFAVYPRHRKLISINKRHTGKRNKEFNLRHDWNSLLSHDETMLFRHYSRDFFPHADDMVRYLSDYAKRFRLNVRYNTNVTEIRATADSSAWNGHRFVLGDQSGNEWRCQVLLVATGMWLPRVPRFIGSELVEGYENVSVNPSDFEGQSVLILGRGNSAFETADNIMGSTNLVHMLGRSHLRLSWATHYVGDLRAINNGLLDTYQLKSLDGLLEAPMEAMAVVRNRQGKLRILLHDTDGRKTLTNGGNSKIIDPSKNKDNFSLREPYDRIVRCLGFEFDFSIFHSSTKTKAGSGQKKKYPKIKADYESPTTRGMFFIGTISHSVDHRKSAGGFIHGFRYTARAVFRSMEWRYHGLPWPSQTLPSSLLLATVARRINEASGPYQMFGVLGDIALLKRDGAEFEYLEEYPIAALPALTANTGKSAEGGLLVVNMEYGKNFSGPGEDVFRTNRAVGAPLDAWRSNFLHPVIYYYERLPTESEMRRRPKKWPLPRPDAIHHMVEDFLTDWSAPNTHLLPLRRFLEACLHRDLRHHFAESCFKMALTSQQSPLSCQQGYSEGRSLAADDLV